MIQSLIRNHLISNEESHEIYEQALDAGDESNEVFVTGGVRGRSRADRAAPSDDAGPTCTSGLVTW
jgi:hypothetical protein